MKTRESGMPQEETWQSFFDADVVLKRLGLTADHRCVVDFGCGFGTFAIPAARIVHGSVYALDIDPEMVEATRQKADLLGLHNVNASQRDFVEHGCGLSGDLADYAMLFNILHAEEAPSVLAEAKRVLCQSGTLAVIHWNYDPNTPRGPSMGIRLRPDQCRRLVERAGLEVGPLVELPPHHFGFTARRVT